MSRPRSQLWLEVLRPPPGFTLWSTELTRVDAEALRIRAPGQVKKPETINYRTCVPERDGMFCAVIFGAGPLERGIGWTHRIHRPRGMGAARRAARAQRGGRGDAAPRRAGAAGVSATDEADRGRRLGDRGCQRAVSERRQSRGPRATMSIASPRPGLGRSAGTAGRNPPNWGTRPSQCRSLGPNAASPARPASTPQHRAPVYQGLVDGPSG